MKMQNQRKEDDMKGSCKTMRAALVGAALACLPTLAGAASPTPEGYGQLVALFQEFRAFQEPAMVDGAPDYRSAAMDRQRQELGSYQQRLAAISTNGWPVEKRADYLLVWAEMNGLEFYHRVMRPWSRDPVFYLISQGGAGPAMSGFQALFDLDLPMPEARRAEYRALLRGLPKALEQARGNLTEAAGDLADIAVWAAPREARMYDGLAGRLAPHHPGLADEARRARDAVLSYGRWVAENRQTMTAAAGIGKENYDWWLKNVHLSPYGWEDSQRIVQREYDRIVTFLKLEEHRNRKLPPLPVAETAEDYYRNMDQALNYVLQFLGNEQIMTIPDWLRAADFSDPSEERGLPSESSIDHKARQREILPGETHEFVGHFYDELLVERDDRPIRGVGRRFNMEWMRMEGWAVALEELTMQAGVLDERPRRGREIEYLMNASHMSLALPDLAMHGEGMSLADARQYCADLMPRGWTQKDERMVWYEMQSNLRFPGFHTGVVLGKAQFMNLFRVRAMQLGDQFVLKEFMDEFLAAGIIPISLIRWEMTGLDDEIRLLAP